MRDTLLIRRDPQASADDTWDEDKGRYTTAALTDPSSADYETVYHGPGAISSAGWQPQLARQGGQEVTASSFTAEVPLDAPTIKENDYIIVEASDLNIHLVDEVFRVKDVVSTSDAVSQELLVERRETRAAR